MSPKHARVPPCVPVLASNVQPVLCPPTSVRSAASRILARCTCRAARRRSSQINRARTSPAPRAGKDSTDIAKKKEAHRLKRPDLALELEGIYVRIMICRVTPAVYTDNSVSFHNDMKVSTQKQAHFTVRCSLAVRCVLAFARRGLFSLHSACVR